MSAFEAAGRQWPEPAHVDIQFTDLPRLAKQEGRLDHPLTLVSPVLLMAYILLPPVAQYSILFSFPCCTAPTRWLTLNFVIAFIKFP
jgi:hypothetical protein